MLLNEARPTFRADRNDDRGAVAAHRHSAAVAFQDIILLHRCIYKYISARICTQGERGRGKAEARHKISRDHFTFFQRIRDSTSARSETPHKSKSLK